MPTIEPDILMEYAGLRLGDAEHLIEMLIHEMNGGKDVLEIRTEAVERQAFLTAYLADCMYRLGEDDA